MKLEINNPWQVGSIVGTIVIQAVGALIWMSATYQELKHSRLDQQRQLNEVVKSLDQQNTTLKEIILIVQKNTTEIAVIKATTGSSK